MKKIAYIVVALGMLNAAAVPGFCAQKKNGTAKSVAPVAKPATGMAMNDDVYVDIKAHEAAFIAAAVKGKGGLELGTMTQKIEFAQLLKKKHDEFKELQKKLLADRKVPEAEYNTFEAKLADEGLSHLTAQLKGIDLKNPKIDDKDGFNARAQRMADAIAKRTAELQAQQVYK
jgi:hypothetical protein